MTYGIFSLNSGTALVWFDSSREAFEAALQIAESEPEAVENLGLVEFDDDGEPTNALQGQELVNAAGGVPA